MGKQDSLNRNHSADFYLGAFPGPGLWGLIHSLPFMFIFIHSFCHSLFLYCPSSPASLFPFLVCGICIQDLASCCGQISIQVQASEWSCWTPPVSPWSGLVIRNCWENACLVISFRFQRFIVVYLVCLVCSYSQFLVNAVPRRGIAWKKLPYTFLMECLEGFWASMLKM